MARIFLVGSGYIGGTVLTEVLKPDVKRSLGVESVVVLARSKERAAQLEELGAEAVLGDLDSLDILTKETERSDIVVHSASADHLASAKAIVEGLQRRAEAGKRTVYLHTSGAAVLDDGANGAKSTSMIYHDASAAQIDALADDQPHRSIDLFLSKASYDLKTQGQAIAIVMPPLIYGEGTGLANRRSVQVPWTIETAVGLGHVAAVGKGENIWSAVHVEDLAEGYVLILRSLRDSTPSSDQWHPYFFITPAADLSGAAADAAGRHEVRLADMYSQVASIMAKKSLIASSEVVWDQVDQLAELDNKPAKKINAVWGSNSRSRADRLFKLGWQPKAGKGRPLILDSLDAEVDAVTARSSARSA